MTDKSGYGQGKIRCEVLLTDVARTQGRADWSILRPPNIWGPDPRCLRQQASPIFQLHERVCRGALLVLPGATEEQWSQFGDDWVDARELAWAAAECLERPLGGPTNAINSHFVWHDFCAELIRLTGSSSTIEHKDLESIEPNELPYKDFFAQPWRYSGERLERRLGFRPVYRWQDTLASAVSARVSEGIQ